MATRLAGANGSIVPAKQMNAKDFSEDPVGSGVCVSVAVDGCVLTVHSGSAPEFAACRFYRERGAEAKLSTGRAWRSRSFHQASRIDKQGSKSV